MCNAPRDRKRTEWLFEVSTGHLALTIIASRGVFCRVEIYSDPPRAEERCHNYLLPPGCAAPYHGFFTFFASFGFCPLGPFFPFSAFRAVARWAGNLGRELTLFSLIIAGRPLTLIPRGRSARTFFSQYSPRHCHSELEAIKVN